MSGNQSSAADSTGKKAALFAVSVGSLALAASLIWKRIFRSDKKQTAAAMCPHPAASSKGPSSFSMTGCPAGYGNAETTSSGVNSDAVRPKRGDKAVYYHDYLCLDQILNAQNLKSLELGGKAAHDEHLFIVIHQAYELWFKQCLHEVGSVMDIFRQVPIEESKLGTVANRLNRCAITLHVIIQQLDILETMSPLDFLDFRDFLFPASGFQSVQFRLFENKLGLKRSQRLNYQKADYTQPLHPDHRALVEEAEADASLFDLIERWLERTPFMQGENFDFWQSYQEAVLVMLKEDRELIMNNSSMLEVQRTAMLNDVDHNWKLFESVLLEEEHNKMVAQQKRRLSWKATQAALLITVHHDEPIFQLPFQILTLLQDLDELLTTWRTRHALMVHRMLGAKLGTGGSSGFAYLTATVVHHKIFADLSNLSMFLLPRSAVPPLPASVTQKLRFKY